MAAANRKTRGRPAQPSTRRRRILEAAAASISRNGYHGMSMRELARSTGQSPATAYNYFSSKEEILFALQKEAFETLISSSRKALREVEDPSARLYVFIHHHVSYFAEHPQVMRVLVHEAGSLPTARRRAIRRLKERYFEQGRDILRDLVTEGCGQTGAAGRPVRDEAEIERIAYSVFGMLNWIYGWYEPAVHGGPQELSRTIHRIVICGVVALCPVRELQESMDLYLDAHPAPPLLGDGPAAETPS